MVRRSIVSSLLVFVAASVCLAAGFNGKWEGSVKTPDGQELPLVFTFNVEGESVTGTIGSPMGELPISNGKISGDTITFDVEFNGTTISHEGMLKDETIAMKSKAPWGDAAFELKHTGDK